MSQTKNANRDSRERSAVQSTLEKVRTAQAPLGGPVHQPLIHRVRNEHTEKEMSVYPWCGFNGNQESPPVIPKATILDCDVTCPVCIEVIRKLQAKVRGNTDEITHFAGVGTDSLCGLTHGDKGVEGLTVAVTLRETTCPKCLDAAEELLVGIINDGPRDVDGTQLRVFLEGGVDARPGRVGDGATDAARPAVQRELHLPARLFGKVRIRK